MDFDLLRDGEQFSNYLGHYQDEDVTLESIHDLSADKMYHWNLDSEIQINTDLGVIPVSTTFYDINLGDANNAPNVNFHQIINGLQQFVDTGSNSKVAIPQLDDILIEGDDQDDLLNLKDPKYFDITKFLKDDLPSPTYSRKHRAGVKKIDMKAQKYIIDEEDDVDVETVSECGDPAAIIQAGDLHSLLEQFEASEVPDLTVPDDFLETTSTLLSTGTSIIKKIDITQDNLLEEGHIECKPAVKIKQLIDEVDVKIKEEKPIDEQAFGLEIGVKIEQNTAEMLALPVKEETLQDKDIKHKPVKIMDNVNIKTQQNEYLNQDIKHGTQTSNNKMNTYKQKDKLIKDTVEVHREQKPQKTYSNICANNPSSPYFKPVSTNIDKNKQITNILPQELINRIKESGKRKCISVIEPIVPNKKQRVSRTAETSSHVAQTKSIFVVPNTVQLDHDYCSHPNVSKNDKKKDSGFESAEEEERTVIEKQPMVKNADGKLMVSLLKVNTIREEKTNKKRKLNLEEYKKRREGIWKSQSSSQNNSPLSSTCNSPLPEDEEVRRRKHQEKLMRMAMEVLRTPAKTEKIKPAPQVIVIPKVAQIPPDMEMKTLVSIGVNTEMRRKKNVDPLAPVEQLEQIKPVLQKISDKISSNSLITSVIENIPKVINSCSPESSQIQPSKQEHGEDKTIVYLPKNRVQVNMANSFTQTNISLIQQTKASRYRRRRNCSTSSSSSSNDSISSRSSTRNERDFRKLNASARSSESNNSSRSSRSSTSSYSSRSYSRSRSRSTSPSYTSRRERDRERLLEVEERRVIYVGRLTNNTTRETLRKRFQRFGPITTVSLHSRQHGDRYGFVTFENKLDAYNAIEHGNDDPYYPKYDLSFGGRRIFCQSSYSDLDNMRDEIGYYTTARTSEESFDKLLKEVQEKLRKRKA